MKIVADFHIHSKYSRATSKLCTLPWLWAWAQRKGITLVGTGDFTHPQWQKELAAGLEPAEPGLFKLKSRQSKIATDFIPDSCRASVRFVLTAEISNIYKKDGKTRKVHNVLVAPDFRSVKKITSRLNQIGNIHSDGRPILGLDSRDLLEITLDSGDGAFLIPAHIWTPWFSLFGSKSGFDDIEECYEDLTGEIFALETGLSSDPSMNWRISALDRFCLVSNSDAHSPGKLGREANLFNCDLDYFAIRESMKSRKGFLGTVEFFPEEGKYHLDGHRKCRQRMDPEETEKVNGLCPVCKKPVTVGVLSRIASLADREPGAKPEGASPYTCLVPLAEALGEVYNQGPATKKVNNLYEKLLEQVGSEFSILLDTDPDQLEKVGGPLTSEAIRRIRSGSLNIEAGYDGQFGTVRIFADGERERLG